MEAILQCRMKFEYSASKRLRRFFKKNRNHIESTKLWGEGKFKVGTNLTLRNEIYSPSNSKQ